MRDAHLQLLYRPLLWAWEKQGAWTEFVPAPFLALLDVVGELHKNYARRVSAAISLVQDEMESNQAFRKLFVNFQNHPWVKGDSWRLCMEGVTRLLGRSSRQLAEMSKLRPRDPALLEVLTPWKDMIWSCEWLENKARQQEEKECFLRLLSESDAAIVEPLLPNARIVLRDYCLFKVGKRLKKSDQMIRSVGGHAWAWCCLTLTDHHLFFAQLDKARNKAELNDGLAHVACPRSLALINSFRVEELSTTNRAVPAKFA
ncbi:hypothetical protein EJ08DRAFT_379212 [Tothia fuscella]|uniref:Uncharacterized protein n=1 Tax=Tothia fuscella TaxID=1048955 RepID=A0A9P4NLG1_9PEZI|nr:hypothetical protein EJ08DRAFT_379212 [Tothia fuscella]